MSNNNIEHLTERQLNLLEFVKIQHGDQLRKYTNEPYWHHPLAVSFVLKNIHPVAFGTEVALCHDLFEDTKCNEDRLREFLLSIGYNGHEAYDIICGVQDLTDQYTSDKFPNINREARKFAETVRLSKIPGRWLTVKLADMIDNTKSIVENDPGFARVYLKEKEMLLSMCDKMFGHPMHIFATKTLQSAQKSLKHEQY